MLSIGLNIEGKNCVIVGGGKVAYRKLLRLTREAAKVTVVAPEICPEIRQLTQDHFTLIVQPYNTHYLHNAHLVFATTNNAVLNQQIATDCKHSGILCNVADDNEAGDFVMQSSASSGGLEISVGTGGQLPWLARHLREAIERRLKTPEIGKLMHEMIEIRREVVAKPLTVAEKRSELQLRLLPLAKATESLLLSAEIEIKQ